MTSILLLLGPLLAAGGLVAGLQDFFAPLVSLLGLSSLLTIVAALAVAMYLPGFRTVAITVGVGAALLFAGIAYGDRKGSTRVQVRWDAADQKAVKDREKRDRDIAAKAEQVAKKLIDELLQLAADSERKALEYETKLKSRPQCLLDDDDIRSMPALR